MTTAPTLTIAHWMTSFSHPVKNIGEWLELLRAQVKKAADAKADILLIPEHISEHWIFFAPPATSYTEETTWMADVALEAMPHVQAMAREHNIAIVAGSTAWRHETSGKLRNRSWMFFPDRDPVFHDKLVMTPSEKDCEGWFFEPGVLLTLFTWRGVKCALIICLDVEMPQVSHLLAKEDIDLLLVPSMTTKKAGYYRVFNCARARAVEQMCAVAVVGCVGAPQKGGKTRDGYHSGAAIYIPSEEIFGHTGIFSEHPLHNDAPDGGDMLISRDIPIGTIRDVRRAANGRAAEAWPGVFDASHITVIEQI